MRDGSPCDDACSVLSRDAWCELMTELHLPASEEMHARLLQAYAEPHRHYHTRTHLQDCLQKLQQHSILCHQPCLVALALWFHDAIYRPYHSGNEQASAQWAMDFLRTHHASAGIVEKVRHLILATAHSHPTNDPDAQVLNDIDLSILGAPADQYDAFEQAVRREYRWVPGPLFHRKRAALLAGFLERPRIYHTDTFYCGYETTARQNLQRTIVKLRG